MKTLTWMFTTMAGLSLLVACGGEDLGEMDSQRAEPPVENLVQSSGELALGALTYYLNTHGGGGGNPTSTACPSGSVAVGIHGRSWSYVDRLGLVCRVLNADGSLGAIYRAGAQGGFGGGDFDILCPDGQAIVGLVGRSGYYIDRLGVSCAAPQHWMAGGLVQSFSRAAGGEGGTFFSEECPKAYVVTSLNLRTDWYVDQEQAVCTLMN